MRTAEPLPLTITSLANGLQVCVSPDPNAPAVSVNLWFEVGSRDETPGRTGFAHLFEHLMFEGSRNVAPGEHMALVEAHGGTVNASTSSDRTNYFNTVPPGALDLVLWLEADRLTSLDISPENFDAQRRVVKEEKRQRYDNQPYGDVLEFLVAQHFPAGHPYAHLPIGSMADLDAAGIEEVQAFFDRWYNPGNARLVVCGNIKTDRALELVETHFGPLPARPAAARRGSPVRAVSGSRTTVMRDVPHPIGYLSWLAPSAGDDAWLATELTLAILADGHQSRLHRELVRGAGIAREVHATALGHLHDASLACVLVRPSQGITTESLLGGVHGVIRQLATAGPTDDELARAVAQHERDWLVELATMEARADAIQDAWLTFGHPGAVNDRMAQLASVTSHDIRRAAGGLTQDDASELHYLVEET